MSVETNDSSQPALTGWEDEIDLRQYIVVLSQWWREVLLFTLLAAGAAAVLLWLLQRTETPQYRSSSDVLIARVVNVANLDERLQTVAEDPPSTARRSALVGLAKSGAIAVAVTEDIGGILPGDLREPAVLLERVDAMALPSTDSRTPSDLIRITATARSPELAAAIANAWADNYVARINDLIGQVPAEVLDSVEQELVRADLAYQEAQTALESFITEERTDQLTREIADRQTQLNTLQLGRQTALTTVINREFSARLNQYVNRVDAQTRSMDALFVGEIESRLDELSHLYAVGIRTRQLLDQARLLLTQIGAGGDAAAPSNTLSIQLLKAQIFAATAEVHRTPQSSDAVGDISRSRQTSYALPANLQLMFPSTDDEGQSAEEQAEDVSAIVTTLEEYLTGLEGRIDQLSWTLATDAFPDSAEQLMTTGQTPENEPAVDNPGWASLTDLDGLFTLEDSVDTLSLAENGLTVLEQELGREIQALQAQLEAESARRLRLTQQRDLAWNAYDALSNKVVELTLEKTATNSEVRLASPAVPPIKPVAGPDIRFIIAIAGALGFFFGVIYSLLAASMGKEPFLARRRTRAADV